MFTAYGVSENKELIDQLAAGLVLTLDQGYCESISYCVVRGLHGEFDNIAVNNQLQLRRMSEQEVKQYMLRSNSHLQVNNPVPSDGVLYNTCVIEFKQKTSLVDREAWKSQEAPKAFRKLLTALRLAKDGEVELGNPKYRTDPAGGINPTEWINWTPMSNRNLPINRKYELADGDGREVVSLFQSIDRLESAKRLRTAVARLNYAAERTRGEDRVLDACIALEAIFGDGSGGLTYKLAFRCAAFLADDMQGRSNVRDQVEEIYKARSAIVHGGLSSEERQIELGKMAIRLSRTALKKVALRLDSGGRIPDADEFDSLLLA